MSADRMMLSRTGTAAEVPYLALPPTAVDARPSGATRLVVVWHGFGPPRTPAAMAAAVPMTGVPAWRVYLSLPAPAGALPPAGLGGETAVADFADTVERAAERFSAVLERLRRDLEVPEGPVALAGFSAGAAVAMLVLASAAVPVSTAAFVAPIAAPARTMAQVIKETGRPYAWTGPSRAAADRLNMPSRAAELARPGAPILLVAGSRDPLVPAAEVARLHDRLAEQGAAVETTTVQMAHALTAEPGVDALPPLPEAVSVDTALTEWFRRHLATVAASAQGPAPSSLQTLPDGIPMCTGPHHD
ncbi:alpha/beta hydrolase [Thermomonospora amylolytica]|uniref:alpha/beta hydrolase n=1 Tax=Thermomonospora amylolytica TaxID=1411117 RepID=UPI0013007A31|nr:dienelactone hydrolase family protein [Thermomonospora amylolytica]